LARGDQEVWPGAHALSTGAGVEFIDEVTKEQLRQRYHCSIGATETAARAVAKKVARDSSAPRPSQRRSATTGRARGRPAVENAAPAESDQERRFPQSLGKVSP